MNKQLYLSRKNKLLGGVAGGLSDYFDIDVTIIRAAFIIATIAWPGTILAYLILLIIVPKEPLVLFGSGEQPDIENYRETKTINNQNKRYLAGVILITGGGILFLHKIIPGFGCTSLMPIALIVLGILILMKSPQISKYIGAKNDIR